MTDFIHIMLVEPFLDTSNYLLMLVGVMSWLWVISMISLIIYHIMYIIDTKCLYIYNGLGVIHDRKYIPKKIIKREVYNYNISQYVEEIYGYSDQWYLKFRVGNKYYERIVTKYEYDQLDISDIVEVSYTTSRLWSNLCIQDFSTRKKPHFK